MLLCLIMVISAFAVIHIGDESATTKAENKDVLWSVDFDDYKGTTNDELTAYLISKGINRNSGWLSITNGKLKNQTTPWTHRSTASDTFRDLSTVFTPMKTAMR